MFTVDLIVLKGIGQLKTDFQAAKIPISTEYILGKHRIISDSSSYLSF